MCAGGGVSMDTEELAEVQQRSRILGLGLPPWQQGRCPHPAAIPELHYSSGWRAP